MRDYLQRLIARIKGNIKLTTHKLDEYLYEVKYTVLDYDFAKAYFRSHYVPVQGGCSVVRQGNQIGRNLDWYYDHEAEFIVETAAGMGRYASKGFAGTIAELTNTEVEEYGILDDIAKVLPFRMLDGINEKGVYASVNMLNNDATRSLADAGTTPLIEEREEICSIMAVRYILDKFASAQEAAEYIRNYVRVYPPIAGGVKHDVQIVVADKTGTWVLSFEGTETRVITDEFHGVVTNFRLGGTTLVDGAYAIDGSSIEDYGSGVERANVALSMVSSSTIEDIMRELHYTHAYDENSPWLTEFVGINGATINDSVTLRENQIAARALYLDTTRDKADTWHTTHTIVYDLDGKMASYYTQQNDSEFRVFFVESGDFMAVDMSNIDEAGKAKIKEIAGGVSFVTGDGLKLEDNTLSVKTDGSTVSFNNKGELTILPTTVSYETVTISLVVTGSVDTLVGQVVRVVELGFGTKSYTIGSSHTVSFKVPKGTTYTIKYPTSEYYAAILDFTRTAASDTYSLVANFHYIGDSVRSVKLEQSSPGNWLVGGSEQVIDNILSSEGEYGTFVIDEIHKKWAKLNPLDHTQFADGTPWSGTYGNAFRRLPKVYFRCDTDGVSNPILLVSLSPLENGEAWEEDWIGTYKGSMVGTKLVSQPNRTGTQLKTMTQFWEAAQQNGANYGLVNYFDHCKLCGLHYAKFGTSNSETTMGKGLQDSGTSIGGSSYNFTTGKTAKLGDKTGQLIYSGSYYQNKLFGIEALAGTTWEFRPNIRFEENGTRAVVYEGNIVSNTATGRAFNKLGVASAAYVKAMVLGRYFDMIPLAVGGSDATYYCDGTYASATGQLLLVGGHSNLGSVAGLASANSYNVFSISYAHLGARLAFKGDISEYGEIISGAEMAALNS